MALSLKSHKPIYVWHDKCMASDARPSPRHQRNANIVWRTANDKVCTVSSCRTTHWIDCDIARAGWQIRSPIVHTAIRKYWLLKRCPHLHTICDIEHDGALCHSHRIHLFFHVLIWIIWWMKRKLFAMSIWERRRKIVERILLIVNVETERTQPCSLNVSSRQYMLVMLTIKWINKKNWIDTNRMERHSWHSNTTKYMCSHRNGRLIAHNLLEHK